MSILKSLENLNMSESCFNDIVALIEAKIIDFQQKRKEKILNKNAQKMNDLLTSGATDAVRILPNGEPMGDPYVVKALKDIKRENDEVMGKKVNEGQDINDTPIGRAANGRPQKFPEEIEADRKEAEKRRKEAKKQEAKIKRQANKKKVFTNNSPGQISFLEQPQENKDN